jgi:hypothetical protein
MKPKIIAQDTPPFEASLSLLFDRAKKIAETGERSVVQLTEQLESTCEFAQVLGTASALERTKATSHWLTGQDKIVVGTFLRRSGVYLSLHAGNTISATDVGRRLRSALLQSHLEVTYLAPIELVHLSKDHLSFDRFTIRQFSANELTALTQNDLRAVFYPWAKLDIEVLKDYWFLVASGTIEVRPLLDLSEILRAFPNRSKGVSSRWFCAIGSTNSAHQKLALGCPSEKKATDQYFRIFHLYSLSLTIACEHRNCPRIWEPWPENPIATLTGTRSATIHHAPSTSMNLKRTDWKRG